MQQTGFPESEQRFHHQAVYFWLSWLLCFTLTSVTASADTYNVDPKSGFRMERYRAPVPSSIPGGLTINTQFALEQHNSGSMQFIDVFPPKGMGADPIDGFWLITEPRYSISGAVWLPEVGQGHIEPAQEDYFKRNLARLTNNNVDFPLLFFCTADCWQSWNAAKRAIDWGYTAVHWYPNGTDGWQDHNLPVVQVAPINFIDDTTPHLFPESASISLISTDGTKANIGAIKFSNKPDGSAAFSLDIGGDQFSDHFLSMRPFKCMTEHKDWYCYLAYPYEIGNTITIDDMTNLEYQLLFIKKRESEFGIDAWNGLYYQLELNNAGEIQGALLQGDLNVLQSPPENNPYPINLDEFFDDDSATQRFPVLVIRP